jgi:hypothetical protein
MKKNHEEGERFSPLKYWVQSFCRIGQTHKKVIINLRIENNNAKNEDQGITLAWYNYPKRVLNRQHR